MIQQKHLEIYTKTDCAPCAQLKMMIEKTFGNDLPNVKWVALEDTPNKFMEHAVQSVPTIIRFEMGIEKERRVGTIDKVTLKNWIGIENENTGNKE